MTTLNNTKNIPLSERPKLFKQMLEKPYDLLDLDPKGLFNYLQAETKIAKLTFKYYSEFLNLINTLIFYYILCYNSSRHKSIELIVFIGVDSSFMVTAFVYYFLVRNKQFKQNTRVILIFGFLGILTSKLINHLSNRPTHDLIKIHKYIKLNFVLFSLAFLLTYDYYSNPSYPSSTMTKMIYNFLAFVMSNLVGSIEAKIRIFIYAINFFEFLPEIRKITISYSNTHNLICYLVNFIWIELFMIYLEKYLYFFRILIGNIAFIIFYPMIFNWFYNRRKKLIKGLWDLPQVTSYY